MTDYSEHPKSITEVKADKRNDCRDWTPRDMFISILRKIDTGAIDVADAVVVFTDSIDAEDKTYGDKEIEIVRCRATSIKDNAHNLRHRGMLQSALVSFDVED